MHKSLIPDSLGPEQGNLGGPYCYLNDDLFRPKLSNLSLPEHTPKLTKLGVHVTPALKFDHLLSSSISTIRWRYNQGKCILPYNSHMV